MTNQAVQEFLNGADIGDGPLTPEQAAALMALAGSGDDTGAHAPGEGGAPATTTAQDSSKHEGEPGDKQPGEAGDAASGAANAGDVAGAKVADESQIDPSNAVVLAKDGVHHIPYATLEKARQGEQHWRTLAEEAQRQLADLQRQASERAAAGEAPTKQDNMVAAAQAAIDSGKADASLFGDFSEEAMAAGIAKLVATEVSTKVDAALKPTREKAEYDATDAHEGEILKAHPDAASMYQSTQLEAWIKAQPTYVQSGIRHALAEGEAKDVIEVFDQYKAATKPAAAAPAADPKAAAKAVIAAVEPKVPETLSGFPGARTGATSVHDQMDAMDAPALGHAMSGMTNAQIEAFLNRNL